MTDKQLPDAKFSAISFSTKPWARLAAKYLDSVVFAFGFGLLLAVGAIFLPPINELLQNELLLSAVIIGLLPLGESLSQMLFGGTLGKSLAGLKIESSGSGKPRFSQILSRNYACLVQGLGLGIPIVGLFTQINAFNSYNKKGISNWDREAGTVLNTSSANIIRNIFTFGFWMVLLFGAFWLGAQPQTNSFDQSLSREAQIDAEIAAMSRDLPIEIDEITTLTNLYRSDAHLYYVYNVKSPILDISTMQVNIEQSACNDTFLTGLLSRGYAISYVYNYDDQRQNAEVTVRSADC